MSNVAKLLEVIRYRIDPAKREGYLAHVREMREHAVDVLGLQYAVYEDPDHANAFTEVFFCPTAEEYEILDERQDDHFRELVARLECFTELADVKLTTLKQVV